MKVTHQIEIRFGDIDVMGHVNNAVYLSYFEQARIKFFNEVVGEEWNWETHGILLARNEIDYLAPVLLNDKMEVETSVDEIGTKSFTLTYEVYAIRQDGRKFCARGKSVLVAFNYHEKRSQRIPEAWREKLSS